MAVKADAVLQDLAAVVDEHAAAISLYLDLDPATTPTRADVRTRVHALLDELGRRSPGEHSPAARRRLAQNMERVRDRLSDAAELRLGHGRRRGAAVFAWGDDGLEVVVLRHRVDDRVSVGRRPAVAAAAARMSRAADVVLLVASREQGRLLRYQDGALTEVFDDHEQSERRHDQGGWAQMTLQRWVDNAGAAHLRTVVGHLRRIHPAIGSPPLIVAADDPARAVIERELSQELAEAVVGWVGSERDWGAARVIDQAEEALAGIDRAREAALLERWRAETGRGEGRSPERLEDILEAVSDGRAEWLLATQAATPVVFRCPNCDRLYAHPGHCPADGEWLVTDDGLDAAACEVVRRSGAVWELLEADNRPFGPGDGIGVLVRY